jgi:hypothetical protein
MSPVTFRQGRILKYFVVEDGSLYQGLAVDWLVLNYAMTSSSSIKSERS